MANRIGWSPGPATWKDDLTPIGAADWNYDRAAHLLAHAGFGGTPAEIEKLADAGLERAVRSLVHYESIPNPRMQPFVESGLWDPTLNAFPESRPEATDRAAQERHLDGCREQAHGQPSRPARVGPLLLLAAGDDARNAPARVLVGEPDAADHASGGEKMALMWHGHFATHENKVRDYRKMMQQIDLFERGATGNIRDLAIQVAQNPAMLYFLDAQYQRQGGRRTRTSPAR